MTDDLFIERTADFSACRTWRYTLKRVWDKRKPVVLFVLLNPSTADEVQDDPTNRRGITYAMDWKCGGVTFCNLFAVRTPDPRVMKAAEDPVGPMNDRWLTREVRAAGPIILAWGTHGSHLGRDVRVLSLLKATGRTLWCLGRTKQGHPKHILYLPRRLMPQVWENGP